MQDATSSTEALNSLQGSILHSSQTGEGMRLEYPLVLFAFVLILLFFVILVPNVWYCLTRTLDMLNHGWACGRSQSNLHAGKIENGKR